jgi:hypothetical protein
VSQIGAAAPHWELVAHDAQIPCVGSQIGLFGGQSVFCTHPTQAPVFGSHSGASGFVQLALDVQAG